MKRIKIRPMAAVLLLWLILSNRVAIGVITLVAAALHEGGHAIAAKIMRIPLSFLRMDLLGARLDVSGRVLSYGEEWLLCAAGPITSLLCAMAAAPFWHLLEYAGLFSCVSFILGLLNLLPVRTFDGGRMLECFLLSFLGERLAGRWMRGCTFLFLFLIWAVAVYLLLRAGDGLSLLCFSMSLMTRFFEGDCGETFLVK